MSDISALATGKLSNSENDCIFIGTHTNLLAYDIQNNTDLFYKDVRSTFMTWKSFFSTSDN